MTPSRHLLPLCLHLLRHWYLSQPPLENQGILLWDGDGIKGIRCLRAGISRNPCAPFCGRQSQVLRGLSREFYAGRKRYSEALQLLLQALTAPTMVVNAITMTCYKLYVLVSLIHTGKPHLRLVDSAQVLLSHMQLAE